MELSDYLEQVDEIQHTMKKFNQGRLSNKI